jgi:hypothetical protein
MTVTSATGKRSGVEFCSVEKIDQHIVKKCYRKIVSVHPIKTEMDILK